MFIDKSEVIELIGKALIWEGVVLSGMRIFQKDTRMLQRIFEINLCIEIMNVQHTGNENSCFQRFNIYVNIIPCK